MSSSTEGRRSSATEDNTSSLPAAASTTAGSGSTTTGGTGSAPSPDESDALANKISVGSRVTLAEDSIILGNVRIGAQSVVHPRASILALGGPIVFGTGCLIEEEAVIINNGPGLLRIGDYNYFEVGCRIEAASIESHNTFEVRSYVAPGIAVGSHCTVCAGCSLLPNPLAGQDPEQLLAQEFEREMNPTNEATSAPQTSRDSLTTGETGSTPDPKPNLFAPLAVLDRLPDRSTVFGFDSRRHGWSGEGVKLAHALHIKHLEHLREGLPKLVALKHIKP